MYTEKKTRFSLSHYISIACGAFYYAYWIDPHLSESSFVLRFLTGLLIVIGASAMNLAIIKLWQSRNLNKDSSNSLETPD